MYLLVGLGNPGDKYKNNRHNVGFMVMDQIASDNIMPAFKSKFSGEITEGRMANQKVMLLKPLTYMNDSGVSVRKCADFYKIPPEKIIVFHDELDIDPSRVKVKQGGGTGGVKKNKNGWMIGFMWCPSMLIICYKITKMNICGALAKDLEYEF